MVNTRFTPFFQIDSFNSYELDPNAGISTAWNDPTLRLQLYINIL